MGIHSNLTRKKILYKTFNSLIRVFSKSRGKNKYKTAEISSLIEFFLDLIFKKANKLAGYAGRDKLTFFDLNNSINEHQIFPFKGTLTNKYQILKKNKKVLINGSTRFLFSNEIFKEIIKKIKIPVIFQDWHTISKKRLSKNKKNLVYRDLFQKFKLMSFYEAVFLCYNYNKIFCKKTQERNQSLKIISNNYFFKNIRDCLFYLAINLILGFEEKGKVSIGLRIVHAIIFNDNLLVFYYYKKAISVLIHFITVKSINCKYKKNKKMVNYSYGIIRQMRKTFFLRSDVFPIKIKYFFLRKLFKYKESSYKRSKLILTLSFIDQTTNELFNAPFYRELKKKKILN